MIDPSTLVMEGGIVVAAASLFPVTTTIGSAGVSPTRFILVQKPDTLEDPKWVACVWQANATGGEPIRLVCEEVTMISVFTPQNIVLVLANNQMLTVTPSGGCGCGSRLKSWQPWGPSVSFRQGPKPAAING